VIGLFYDTETTGLPLFSEPSEDPRQPHIVQLAACLVDLDTRQTIASMDVIVQPRGWEIPDDVAAIHGITTERASEVGIPESIAVSMFIELYRFRTRIAHNEAFDARILQIALLRHAIDAALPDTWKGGAAICTQALSTPILRLPPTQKMIAAGRLHHKSANLREAYRHFTGNELAGAHNAMVDVQACMAVYFAILDQTRRAAAAV
jgi:DNA polymerase-3 subunit epsilon